MKTPIERKDAYNMQIPKDWNTLRLSKITLLSDPAAKLIRMTVHVFSVSSMCVESPIQIHPITGQQKLEEVMERTFFFHENLNMAARKVQFLWHVFPGASTLDIKKHIQIFLNGQDPESLDEWITFMSMFNDIEWTKKGNTETCLHNAKEAAAFATQLIQARTPLVLPGARVSKKIRGGTEMPTNHKENEIVSHCRWLPYSSVTLHIQYVQRQSHFSLGQLRDGGINNHFHGTRDNKNILTKTILAKQLTVYSQSNLPVV